MKRIILCLLLNLFLALAAFDAAAKNMYIPVAGVARGANNTFFRTDVRIFNPSDTDTISVSVHFLPQGMDGSNISGRIVNVPPRQMAVLNNIVGDFFGFDPGWVGALRLDSDTDMSYEFMADSRTYTTTPNTTASYGQFIPALDVTEARKKTVILHLSHTPEFRTNAGVMNPQRTATTVKASLYGHNGVRVLESAPFVIEPMSMRQFSMLELFGGLFAQDFYIVFESTEPVFTYGSVIDNLSGDAIFVRGLEDKAGKTPL